MENMDDRKSIVIRVSPEIHKMIKMTALSQGMTLQTYALMAIMDKVEKEKIK